MKCHEMKIDWFHLLMMIKGKMFEENEIEQERTIGKEQHD